MLGETSAQVILSHLCDKDMDKGTLTHGSDFYIPLRRHVSSRSFQLELQACSFDYMPFHRIVFRSWKEDRKTKWRILLTFSSTYPGW